MNKLEKIFRFMKIESLSWPFVIFFMDKAKELLGDLIEWDEMSEQQTWILEQRARCVAVHQLVKNWKQRYQTEAELGIQAFYSALMRAALGITWTQTVETGNLPYLCPKDLKNLEIFIEKAAEEGEYHSYDDVVQEAKRLKIERNRKAVSILIKLKHQLMANDLLKIACKQPTPQWVAKLQTILDIKTTDLTFIEQDRFYACNVDVIRDFHIQFKELITTTPDALLFGADETMLNPKVHKRVVVPENLQKALQEGLPDLQHITAMCMHNIKGDHMPLFIILKNLKKLPDELQEFAAEGKAFFASSSKAYMTRDLFLLWSINFINWVSNFRHKLSSELRERSALLILDGHVSRECPLALYWMAQHNIRVLVLPSHVTHVMQIFDVALAAPMKSKFSSVFRKTVLNPGREFSSKAALIRYAAVHAAITGWESSCTADNCKNGAKKTGMRPYSLDELLQNPYVRLLNEEEQVQFEHRQNYALRRFLCSGKLMTLDENFLKLINQLRDRPDLSHLTNCVTMQSNGIIRYANYVETVNCVKTWDRNNSRSLSKIFPYFPSNSAPVMF